MEKEFVEQITVVSDKVKNLFKGMSDRDSVSFQLSEWVKGHSYHNPVRNECCPDFSCCSGGPAMFPEVREKFAEAHRRGDHETSMEILGMALSGLAATTKKKIHIAGESNTLH